MLNINELQSKAIEAAERFLDRKGYELLEMGYTSPAGTTVDLIAEDDCSIVFIDVTATLHSEGGFQHGHTSREELEMAAAAWLSENEPEGDVQVRFDVIDMIVVSESRALLRHHINALGNGVD